MARVFSGARLRNQRERAGLSPEQLALAVRRSCYSIAAYERGRARPPVHVTTALADAVGCGIDDLLDDDQAVLPSAA